MKENSVEILLVEDNMSDAELAVRALRKKNLANNLVHLKNGAEALDFIFARGAYSERAMEQFPKVILLDLKMPKVNGIEVLQKIREDKRTRKIPVVVLTSSNEDPDIDACYELGVNSYIVKPVEFDNFSKAISELGFYWLLLNQVPHNIQPKDRNE
ncbi:MAG TPA: response regulator [Chryseosolibacter sp.]|jgi:FOG: CheY-like receiver